MLENTFISNNKVLSKATSSDNKELVCKTNSLQNIILFFAVDSNIIRQKLLSTKSSTTVSLENDYKDN